MLWIFSLKKNTNFFSFPFPQNGKRIKWNRRKLRTNIRREQEMFTETFEFQSFIETQLNFCKNTSQIVQHNF